MGLYFGCSEARTKSGFSAKKIEVGIESSAGFWPVSVVHHQCKVLTWQELSRDLPERLQQFLEAKYGILV